MDTKEFLSFIKSKQKEIDELQKRRLPVMVGRMAKDHFPGQLPAGRVREPGTASLAEASQAPCGWHRSGEQLQYAAFRA